MREWIGRFRRELPPLWEATRAFWIWLIIIAAVLTIACIMPGRIEDRVRWSGIFFELFGVVVVAVGLNEASKQFRKTSLWSAAMQTIGQALYLVKARPIEHRVISAEGHSFGTSFGYARMRVTRIKVEDRLLDLEKRCDEYEKELEKLKASDQELEKAGKKLVEDEAVLRKAAIDELRQHLERSMIGSVHLEAAGIGFLIIGILLANASEDFANLFRLVGIS